MIERIDAARGLSQIEDETLDAIITSPPYKISEGYSETLLWNVAQVAWLALKPGGLFYLNFGQLAEDPFRPFKVAEMFSKFFEVGPVVSWVKSMPEIGGHFTPLNGNRWLNRKWEPIFIFGKGSVALDRFSIGVPYRDKSNIKRRGHKLDLQCRGDVWFCPMETRTGKKGHPYQWPRDLCKLMIKSAGLTAGGKLLDPFAGSGILGDVAHEVNPDIKFMGFDNGTM